MSEWNVGETGREGGTVHLLCPRKMLGNVVKRMVPAAPSADAASRSWPAMSSREFNLRRVAMTSCPALACRRHSRE